MPIFNEVTCRAPSEVGQRNRLSARTAAIQVLDDSTDDTRELPASCVETCKAGFNVELIHRVDRRFQSRGVGQGLRPLSDFVCILDADFVPQPSFKKDIHFFTDPKVA